MSLSQSPRSFRTVLFALFMIVSLSVQFAACSNKRSEGIFDPHADKVTDETKTKIAAEIAHLKKGKDPSDIEASAIYSDAVASLTARGSTIEPQMIETLNGSDDWAVRMGSIEVLSSVGSKACVESLIAALEDPQPLVALHAEFLLRGLCKHRVIPEAGQPVSADGVPPLPVHNPEHLALDSEEKAWSDWHRVNHVALRNAWSNWWKTNKTTTTVD